MRLQTASQTEWWLLINTCHSPRKQNQGALNERKRQKGKESKQLLTNLFHKKGEQSLQQTKFKNSLCQQL